MNIEELSKSQLLFLMIFVNFIVSIATGILTVSLLDQAPVQVTETVNRIVDHTVDEVATGTPLATIVSPPTITKTVVESDNDLLPAAVAADTARTVQIYSAAGTSTPALAEGTYLPEARAVVTDTLNAGLPTEVLIVFPNGMSEPASISHEGATLTIYGFSDSAVLPKAPTPKIVPSSSLEQGQTVIALTADGSAVTGIVSKVDADGVHTNLPDVPAGAALVDLSSDVIGISSGSAGLYFDAAKITILLTASSTASAITPSAPSAAADS